MAHQHGIEHIQIFKGELVLAQLAEPLAAVEHDIASAGHKIAAQNFHESGLAAAVRADQPVTVAFAEFDGDIFKQGLGPELHGDVGGGNQGMVILILRVQRKAAILAFSPSAYPHPRTKHSGESVQIFMPLLHARC